MRNSCPRQGLHRGALHVLSRVHDSGGAERMATAGFFLTGRWVHQARLTPFQLWLEFRGAQGPSVSKVALRKSFIHLGTACVPPIAPTMGAQTSPSILQIAVVNMLDVEF